MRVERQPLTRDVCAEPSTPNLERCERSHPLRREVVFQLLSLETPSVSGPDSPDGVAAAVARDIELVSALTHPGCGIATVTLRYTSEPDADVARPNRIGIQLLCTFDPDVHSSSAEASVSALLRAALPECEFAEGRKSSDRSLLYGFGIRRRFLRVEVDGAEPVAERAALGFCAGEYPISTREAHTALHVAPFARPLQPSSAFFRMLSRTEAPVTVTVQLQRTRLSADEDRFLLRQVTECEAHAQAGIGSALDLTQVRPTLREQARTVQQYLAGTLQRLRYRSIEASIQIASPEPVSPTLASAYGQWLTAPAGGSQLDLGLPAALCGGFELYEIPPLNHGFNTRERWLRGGEIDLPEDAGRLPFLFDISQAAAIFRIPSAREADLSGMRVRRWHAIGTREKFAAEGCLLGRTVGSEPDREVRIGRLDRLRHMYVAGQTGAGKTTLLATMIADDIRGGRGVCVLDPHGDLFRDLLGVIPEERIDDVVVIDPSDVEWPVGMNLLECDSEAQRHFVIQELVGIIARMVTDEFGPEAMSYMGPIFFQHMRMNLLLVMSNPEIPGTLVDFFRIYQEKNYWRRWLPLRSNDPQLSRWVEGVLPATDYLRQGSDGSSMGAYISSKFEEFVFNPMLRNIFGQRRSSVDLAALMYQGKIVLVNLARGLLTDSNSRFLGMLLLAKLQAVAMSRVRVPQAERRDFYVYVDEFQNVATQNFISLLSEGRKFGVGLVLANQYISQVRDPRIMQSIFGNIGSLIAFRVGQQDAELMDKEFEPAVTRSDLLHLPNWHAYIRPHIEGCPAAPFTICTVPPGAPDGVRASEVVARSRAAFARSRMQVESEIYSNQGGDED